MHTNKKQQQQHNTTSCKC